MWLLDAKSVRLVSFANQEEIPPYAILSHTWTNEEVSFRDIMSVDTGTNLATMAGWFKIKNACRLTLSFGLSYVWIDTCCIDKSSSAELQEAINSMFKWYELANICFAYLADVSVYEDIRMKGSSFRHCRWFKRGRTLQELLAPIEVAFYDQDWRPISTRGQTKDLIEVITGIRPLYLSRLPRDERIYETLSRASVAERMSWMAKRETTRPEDLAYCLLGLFDINMPMLYGEGSKAFQRLQEEIMKKCDDCTLLSWGYQELCSNWRWEQASLLAPHPSSFKYCRDIEPCSLEGFNAASFSMNQRGLQMKVPTECFPETGAPKSFVAIPLISTSAYNESQIGEGTQEGEYLRPKWCRPTLVSKKFLSQAKSISLVIRRSSDRLRIFRELPLSIAFPPIPIPQGYIILGTYPPQPIGSQFISLQPYPSQVIADSAEEILPPPVPSSIIYSKEDQRMIRIKVPPLGTFVVVLGYRAVARRVTWGMTFWQCLNINCRVFKLPDRFDLEALHSLSITQDFTNLQEFNSQFRGDRYIFNIGVRANAYIAIQFSKEQKELGITDVYISMAHPLDNSHEQEEVETQEGTEINMLNWLQDHRRMAQLHGQASPRLTDSVRRELMTSFPTYSTAHSLI
ncbi:hypothetical protein FOXG_19287 [Fusarium oxysporum f. sp. lycopersici 4287]|uniref:Heterokaryon incompatibility domain-containing protein n=1 Tax=Fusarium oxysporum f. sp. lycopersici (strain 4287 / CBS 123668 / FGSC 9935 / NRRL 34936) TaxID=426428 RepID=A0A0J9V0L0_FUSO4|nr:hypothetical protein FOXG_19287 [Fusarium oxysporum f. sp. lycopersici 4287]KNB04411.1 hypothetical protein FOXG_19287 [Fusarium oxysporum f. sp. lycopersici 4287]